MENNIWNRLCKVAFDLSQEGKTEMADELFDIHSKLKFLADEPSAPNEEKPPSLMEVLKEIFEQAKEVKPTTDQVYFMKALNIFFDVNYIGMDEDGGIFGFDAKPDFDEKSKVWIHPGDAGDLPPEHVVVVPLWNSDGSYFEDLNDLFKANPKRLICVHDYLLLSEILEE